MSQVSDERLSVILETAGDAFVAMDEQGKITAFNGEAERLFGWPRDEVVGRPLAEVVVPEPLRDAHRAGLARFLATGEQVLIGKLVEIEALHRDGHLVPVEFTIGAYGDAGAWSFHAFVRDITDRRRREQELAEAQRELERQQRFTTALLDSITEGVVACDARGELALFNSATRRMHGIAEQALPPERWAERYDLTDEAGDLLPTERIPLFRAFAGETVVGAEMNINPKGLPPRRVVANGRPIVDEHGERLGAVVSMHDVTDLHGALEQLGRKNAELERSNSDLEQFAYIASHDLSEPLRSIGGFVRLLEKRYADQLDATAQQYIAYATAGVERMSVLIRDLLTFSRVGSAPLERQLIDLESAIGDTLGVLGPLIAEHKARIDVPAQLPQVSADPGQLGQLLQNVLANAVKYVPEGRTPRIAIECSSSQVEHVLRISDNGIGIDPQYRTRVFGMFQRLHSRDAFEGTGVGLAICLRIADRHGWRIWVEDPPSGEGTTVAVAMPARR